MNWLPFNMNNYVRVKIGAAGHEHLRLISYSPRVVEDDHGRSRWQLWHLAEIFGPLLSLGSSPPFDMAIEVAIPDDLLREYSKTKHGC